MEDGKEKEGKRNKSKKEETNIECKYHTNCKYGKECWHKDKERKECRNGFECKYYKQNRCQYQHGGVKKNKNYKCRNGPKCQYKKQNRCIYKHDERNEDGPSEKMEKEKRPSINRDRARDKNIHKHAINKEGMKKSEEKNKEKVKNHFLGKSRAGQIMDTCKVGRTISSPGKISMYWDAYY